MPIEKTIVEVRMILAELKRLDQGNRDLRGHIEAVEKELNTLQIKSAESKGKIIAACAIFALFGVAWVGWVTRAAIELGNMQARRESSRHQEESPYLSDMQIIPPDALAKYFLPAPLPTVEPKPFPFSVPDRCKLNEVPNFIKDEK